jgi:hypothetical protein
VAIHALCRVFDRRIEAGTRASRFRRARS